MYVFLVLETSEISHTIVPYIVQAISVSVSSKYMISLHTKIYERSELTRQTYYITANT